MAARSSVAGITSLILLASCGQSRIQHPDRLVGPTIAGGQSLKLEAEAGAGGDGNLVRALSINVDPGQLTNAYTVSDGSASGGQAVELPSTNSSIRFYLPSGSAGGNYTVRVQGRGDYYQGWPTVKLSVNNVQVATYTFTASTWATYSFGAQSIQPGQPIDVTFTNDAYGGSASTDRNAYVDYLVLDNGNQTTAPAPPPSPAPGQVGVPGATGDVYVGPNASYKSIQAGVNAASWGQTVVVQPGTYREKVWLNKSLKLVGQPGAVVKGSDVVTNWWQEGAYYVTSYSYWFSGGGQCLPNSNYRCQRPDEVFVDGAPQFQQTTLGAIGQGSFYVGNGKLYLGSSPWGHTVEVSTRDGWLSGNASNVTVRGLTFLHAANNPQVGAINDAGQSNWVIDGNEVAFSAGVGIKTDGYGTIAKNNIVHDNGQEGFSGSGSNLQILNNKIYNNNTEDFDPSWEAGGSKWATAKNLVVSGNESYANKGWGLACDVSCDYTTWTNNRVHDNGWAGIHYEISDHGSIHDNVVWNNGRSYNVWVCGAGILVEASNATEVYNNTVAWNAAGIGVIQSDRYGPYTDIWGNYIHNNTIIGSQGDLLGWVSNATNQTLFQSWTNNHAAYNRYYQTGSAGWAYKNFTNNLPSFIGSGGDSGAWMMSQTDANTAMNAASIPTWPSF